MTDKTREFLLHADGMEIGSWTSSTDGARVIQIDTLDARGRLRINLNEATVWDGDPEADEPPTVTALRTLRDEASEALARIEASREADTLEDVFDARDTADAVLRRLVELTKGLRP